MYLSKPKKRPFRIGGSSNGLMHVLRIGKKAVLYEYHYSTAMGSSNPSMIVYNS